MHWSGYVLIVCVVALVIMLAVPVFLSATAPMPAWNFQIGETVSVKLDGRNGMIVARWRYQRTPVYRIRFAHPQSTTGTRLIAEDGPIKHAPYSEVIMQEFELRALDRQSNNVEQKH